MKRTFTILLAMLLMVGMANAQNAKRLTRNNHQVSQSCIDMKTAVALGLETIQKANAVNRDVLAFADFEDGSWGDFTPSFTSAYPWEVVAADNGSDSCIMTTNAGIASSESAFELTYTFDENGYINFDAICMGEGTSTAWDKCEFYIDGTSQFSYGAHVANQGWVNYNFEVAAGEHTFKWSYTKDSSVNPTGDYMAVDNIAIGSGAPCIAPSAITVSCNFTTAVCTWNGAAEKYILRYRPIDLSSEWTTVNEIEGKTYTLTGLEEYTDYEVEVAAECDDENWASEEFTTSGSILSTATFYGYATYDMGNIGIEDTYITFTAQNPADVEIASSAISETYGASYALGYMWYIPNSNVNDYGTLYKAPIDAEGNIGEPEVVVNGFDTEATALGMAYNNADGLMYYVTVDDDGVYTLKSFNPMNAEEGFTTIGSIEAGAQLFAINADGDAYCISSSDGNLYSLDLTDASTEVIGNTGMNVAYVQSMAFDMETGELFWAQIYSGTDYGFYRVNTETGHAEFVGQIGGGAEVTGMFMVWGELPDCATPTDLEATDVTNHEATITWAAGGDEELWSVTINGETQTVEETTLELTGLDAETEYTVSVVALCSADDASFAATIRFTTEVACAQPTNVNVDVDGLNAIVTWEGEAGEYNLRYKPYTAPENPVVTLTVGDVWGDGSGYQMLLDADANTYGTIIPETGGLTSSGNVPASTYAEFEYKIPENADGALTTSNIVINNSISVEITAGTYDWCITNPTPGDRVWIASSGGSIPGRYDDYEFEGGKSYEFTVSFGGQNDQVDLTITDLRGAKDDVEWTVVNGITDNTYTIEGLEPSTEYIVEVQAVCGGNDGESLWTRSDVFTTTDGINENNANVSIYPNPTDGNININANGMTRVTVMNALGQVVYDNEAHESTIINMGAYGAGVYMVNITTDGGNIVRRVSVAK